jgi:hypothetical protein
MDANCVVGVLCSVDMAGLRTPEEVAAARLHTVALVMGLEQPSKALCTQLQNCTTLEEVMEVFPATRPMDFTRAQAGENEFSVLHWAAEVSVPVDIMEYFLNAFPGMQTPWVLEGVAKGELYENGVPAEVGAGFGRGFTPLMACVEFAEDADEIQTAAQIAKCEVLLRYGASMKAASEVGTGVLHLAVFRRNVTMVAWLVKEWKARFGNVMPVHAKLGKTPAELAVSDGVLDIAALFSA